MIDLEDLGEDDLETLLGLLQNHLDYTKSSQASYILSDWPKSSKKFIKVMPTDYKRALEMMADQESEKTL